MNAPTVPATQFDPASAQFGSSRSQKRIEDDRLLTGKGLYSDDRTLPRQVWLVFVRSPSHFRASYAPIAARIFLADTPGPTCLNMRRIPFTKVTRPFYPLDLVND